MSIRKSLVNGKRTPQLPVMEARLAFTIAEAAQALSCCERTVYHLIAAGRLTKFALGAKNGDPRIPRASIERLMAGGADHA